MKTKSLPVPIPLPPFLCPKFPCPIPVLPAALRRSGQTFTPPPPEYQGPMLRLFVGAPVPLISPSALLPLPLLPLPSAPLVPS